MRILLKLLSGLCLLVFISVTCAAQGKMEVSSDASPPPMQPFTTIKEIGRAKIEYYKYADKTIIKTSTLLVQGDWRNGIMLSAGYEVSGKEVTKPANITLTLRTSAGDRTYADDRTLRILVNGKAVLSGTSDYQMGNTKGVIYQTFLKKDMPYELFLKVINSKRVKMQIGPTVFELNERTLEALRDLKKLIE